MTNKTYNDFRNMLDNFLSDSINIRMDKPEGERELPLSDDEHIEILEKWLLKFDLKIESI